MEPATEHRVEVTHILRKRPLVAVAAPAEPVVAAAAELAAVESVVVAAAAELVAVAAAAAAAELVAAAAAKQASPLLLYSSSVGPHARPGRSGKRGHPIGQLPLKGIKVTTSNSD